MLDGNERQWQAIEHICTEPMTSRLDRMLNECRALVGEEFGWRYQICHACCVALQMANIGRERATFEGNRLLDLGSGSTDPFAAVALMHINRAGSTIRIGLEDLGDERKPVPTTFHLAKCLAFAERWNILSAPAEVLLECFQKPDLAGLRRCSI